MVESKGVVVHYLSPKTHPTHPDSSFSLLTPADVAALVQKSLIGGCYSEDVETATHIIVHHKEEASGGFVPPSTMQPLSCGPLWLFASAEAGEWVDPTSHPMYMPFQSAPVKGAAAFGSGTITQTGFAGWQRKLVPTLLYCANLPYCRHLIHSETPQKTCIVIAEDVDAMTAKTVAAKSAGIPIVNLKWLLDSLEEWCIQPFQEYSQNDPNISLVFKKTDNVEVNTDGMVCDSEESEESHDDGSCKETPKQGREEEPQNEEDPKKKPVDEVGVKRRRLERKESVPSKQCCEVAAHVALTSMHSDQQRSIIQRSKQKEIAGLVVHPSDERDHGWSAEFTHLVAPLAVTRTQKCLAALAAGIWIVRPEFIEDFNKTSNHGECVEERHEIMRAGSSAVETGVARHWRLQRQTTGHGAFYGLKFAISNDLKRSTAGKRPDKEDLVAIIEAGQGEVVPISNNMVAVDVVIAPSTIKRPIAAVKRCINQGAVCVAPGYVVDWLAMPHALLDEHVLLSSRRSDALRAFEKKRASLKESRPTGSSASVSL